MSKKEKKSVEKERTKRSVNGRFHRIHPLDNIQIPLNVDPISPLIPPTTIRIFFAQLTIVPPLPIDDRRNARPILDLHTHFSIGKITVEKQKTVGYLIIPKQLGLPVCEKLPASIR